jgi:hypothetical protein
MTWYADLTEYKGVPKAISHSFKAVGWLAKDKPYSRGPVNREVFDRLKTMAANMWYPPLAQSAGLHECDLCLYEGRYGRLEFFIPGQGFLYVCPVLITHYMNEHAYAPPKEFCDAVIACPPFHTLRYMKAFLANGGRELIRGSRRQKESV